MAQVALPRATTFTAAVPRLLGSVLVLMLLLLVAGCASWHRSLPTPPDVTEAGVSARVLLPPNLNVNPAETVVKPGTPGQGASDPSVSRSLEAERTTFALTDTIAFALQNSPRLRSARAAIERARGQEQVAFAPFLPQIDLLGQYGVVSGTLAPGVPGNEGFLLANGSETRSYAQTEVALEWTLYDFGRTSGRYRQAVARERVAELQLVRADQTTAFDVATAYLDVLLARASRRVQEDAVRRAEATLDDTVARRKGGVALREDVLRAEVQLSESREALVLARQGELDAVARLNNAMGRNAGLPLEVIDLEVQPPLPGALSDLLAQAASQRPEIGLARQVVTAAQEGRQAARAEFLPRIFVRADAGHTDGQNVITGWQEGVGLHVVAPLYAGGRHRGELRSAEADIEAALANAQAILAAISLQVNLAYRGVVAARERIELSRTAVVQAEENLRLVRVRYRNGNATPTDIVDSEAALTRSQQRFFSATYTYLAALARLDYAVGQHQDAFLAKVAPSK
ncbi:MAG TPA: TolC family protein [Gemmataceae bacterium]|nr:TolC family protein [Gemmataceae bacterium]